MPAPLVILCPGQGAQAVGMGKSLFDESLVAREVFETANRVLGYDLASICFDGPEDRLNQTDLCQPAIFATSVASFRDAVEKGVIDPKSIAAFAGLSLGEYTALHLADAVGFAEGLRLVATRGRLMQEASEVAPSGMVALIGNTTPVRKLCEQAAEGEVLVPANYNAPGQVVVSGGLSACQRLLAIAETQGMRGQMLKVAGAFHSPLMQGAADQMKIELDRSPFDLPTVDVYSNVSGLPHRRDVSTIKEFLIRQITNPVLWQDTMQNVLSDSGEEPRFVELAPGRTLTGLIKRVNRRLAVESLG